jgi:leucyl-tRNA synthetase
VHDAHSSGAPDVEVMRKLHRTIRKVGEDTARLSYNTAIAAMMEYMNALRASERVAHRAEVEPLVQLVAPFAPHIAEELWEPLGHESGVFESRWPSFDPALATVDEIELVVQVNGKVRGKIRVARDIAEEAAVALAHADAGIARFLTSEPRKIIFVPGRLLNIVV